MCPLLQIPAEFPPNWSEGHQYARLVPAHLVTYLPLDPAAAAVEQQQQQMEPAHDSGNSNAITDPLDEARLKLSRCRVTFVAVKAQHTPVAVQFLANAFPEHLFSQEERRAMREAVNFSVQGGLPECGLSGSGDTTAASSHSFWSLDFEEALLSFSRSVFLSINLPLHLKFVQKTKETSKSSQQTGPRTTSRTDRSSSACRTGCKVRSTHGSSGDDRIQIASNLRCPQTLNLVCDSWFTLSPRMVMVAIDHQVHGTSRLTFPTYWCSQLSVSSWQWCSSSLSLVLGFLQLMVESRQTSCTNWFKKIRTVSTGHQANVTFFA